MSTLDAMDDPQWLTADQQVAWRKLANVMITLPAALEAQLQRDSGMSHFEYSVLVELDDAPHNSIRLSWLAARSHASLSRISHVVTRMEKRGWVRREPSPTDSRAMLAVLTENGRAELVRAAPGHVELVRSLVFSGLDDETTSELGRVCDALLRTMPGSAARQEK
ncbi:MarR family winged helix-turn-helix transcriptional regulator [Antrihabitans spumae]|jgi:DNA-binding MarR family transcriptional regulator|uniref:MarR family winged helix-turn-helix transcriptional regulator n=1 Tax=Antrihabitans spumae TaxID=3373370 RepID=A0ABW7KKG9_9NOCA